jgi:hypothetical protein
VLLSAFECISLVPIETDDSRPIDHRQMYMLDVYACQASASLTEARRALRILRVAREWWIAPFA